jgi:hypothetical protein
MMDIICNAPQNESMHIKTKTNHVACLHMPTTLKGNPLGLAPHQASCGPYVAFEDMFK